MFNDPRRPQIDPLKRASLEKVEDPLARKKSLQELPPEYRALFMKPLEMDQFSALAVCIDSAIKSAKANRYKERDIDPLTTSAWRLKESGRGNPDLYLRLLQLVQNLDCEALLPWFKRAEREIPLIERGPNVRREGLTGRILGELFNEASMRGQTDFLFRREPEVVGWVRETAFRISGLVEDHPAFQSAGPAGRAEIMLGVLACVNLPHHKIEPAIGRQSLGPHAQEVSLFAGMVRHLRYSLLISAFELIEFTAGLDPAVFEAEVSKISRLRFRPHCLPGGYGALRSVMNSFKEEVGTLARCLESLRMRREIPSLAELLRQSPYGSARADALPALTLPYGYAVFIRVYGEKPKHLVLYEVDGFEGRMLLAHSDPSIESSLSLKSVAMQVTSTRYCQVSNDGLIGGRFEERFAIPPDRSPEQERAAVIMGAAKSCNQQLLEIWAEYPRLFSELYNLGPFIFVQDAESLYLLAKRSVSPKVQEFLGRLPDETIEADSEIFSLGSGFEAFLLHKTAVELPPSEPETIDYRAKLRELLERNGRPNYDEFVRMLAPFGVYQDLSAGHGSHGALFRGIGNGVKRQTTSKSIRRRNKKLSFQIIHDTLEQLGIGTEEFFRSLI